MLQREPQGPTTAFWPKPDASLVAYVQDDRRKTLQAYRIKPEYIREHFDIEQAVLSSGYRYRQVFEVVQNAADAILEAPNSGGRGGRILVRVTNSHLYVANTGAPLSKDGIIALLGAHSSRKGKTQIGRFGLGFKSLLALEGKIDLFSRSVSIGFDPVACQRAISEELSLAADDMAPSLRMADVISFDEEARGDEHLLELGPWATTILRAEITAEGLETHLTEELKKFPREFVLFLPVDVSVEDDAWRRIGEAMSAVETTKEKWHEAEVHRIAGDVALLSPEPDRAKAQGYFEHALAVARQQQAKSWELRAAMSMARLWRDQGKRDEARELLAPVYGWFTEGFDTRDLKEAKALLDELVS